MNKKLKLTKLTVSNLDRIMGGDPVCFCQIFPDGSSDEACQQVGGFPSTMIKTQCGNCNG